MVGSMYEILSAQIRNGQQLKEHVPTRDEEVQAQVYCLWEFIDVIEELYPNEFEKAYEEYKKRTLNEKE